MDTPNLDLSGKPKRQYAENERVFIDWGPVKGRGRIRGLASTGLVDFWIVELDMVVGVDKAAYPWSCMTVSHSALRPIDNTEASIPALG